MQKVYRNKITWLRKQFTSYRIHWRIKVQKHLRAFNNQGHKSNLGYQSPSFLLMWNKLPPLQLLTAESAMTVWWAWHATHQVNHVTCRNCACKWMYFQFVTKKAILTKITMIERILSLYKNKFGLLQKDTHLRENRDWSQIQASSFLPVKVWVVPQISQWQALVFHKATNQLNLHLEIIMYKTMLTLTLQGRLGNLNEQHNGVISEL